MLLLFSLGGAIYFVLFIDDVMIIAIFMLCAIALILFHIIINDIHLRKKVKLWLQDAVEVEATTKTIGSVNWEGYYTIRTIRIEVTFKYKGKTIIKKSGVKNAEQQKMSNSKSGYNTIFRKFTNRTIRILYSEKYDQVLLLYYNKNS